MLYNLSVSGACEPHVTGGSSSRGATLLTESHNAAHDLRMPQFCQGWYQLLSSSMYGRSPETTTLPFKSTNLLPAEMSSTRQQEPRKHP